MIFDTVYWKKELERLCRVLRQHCGQRRWRDASYGSLEKAIMLGFYAIRKMSGAFQPKLQIPDPISVTLFPPRQKITTSLYWPDVKENYDLDKPQRITLPVCGTRSSKALCHQIIHSYVFTPCFSDDGVLQGIFFVSDNYKKDGVYYLKIEQVIKLFDDVARSTAALKLRIQPARNRIVCQKGST